MWLEWIVKARRKSKRWSIEEVCGQRSKTELYWNETSAISVVSDDKEPCESKLTRPSDAALSSIDLNFPPVWRGRSWYQKRRANENCRALTCCSWSLSYAGLAQSNHYLMTWSDKAWVAWKQARSSENDQVKSREFLKKDPLAKPTTLGKSHQKAKSKGWVK